jgi:dnd system-associated protein 4
MVDAAPIDDNALMNIETDFYQSLFDGRLCPSAKDPERKKGKEYPFHHMWELFVYAAILGIKNNKTKEIDKPHKPFRWLNIGSEHQKNLLILLVAKRNSLEVLGDKDGLKKMLEEYANGGLVIMDQEIKNNPSAYTDSEAFITRLMNEAI